MILGLLLTLQIQQGSALHFHKIFPFYCVTTICLLHFIVLLKADVERSFIMATMPIYFRACNNCFFCVVVFVFALWLLSCYVVVLVLCFVFIVIVVNHV